MSDYFIYIKQITQELEQEIMREAAKADILEFPDSPQRYVEPLTESPSSGDCTEALQQSIMYTQMLKETPVLFYRGLTSYYACVRHVVIFCKRIIRKLAHFIMEPLVEEINRNRMFTALALEGIEQQLTSQDVDVDAKKCLQSEIEMVIQENRRLTQRVQRLEAALGAQRRGKNGGMWDENTSAG